jgi:hypothetical protein
MGSFIVELKGGLEFYFSEVRPNLFRLEKLVSALERTLLRV